MDSNTLSHHGSRVQAELTHTMENGYLSTGILTPLSVFVTETLLFVKPMRLEREKDIRRLLQ